MSFISRKMMIDMVFEQRVREIEQQHAATMASIDAERKAMIEKHQKEMADLDVEFAKIKLECAKAQEEHMRFQNELDKQIQALNESSAKLLAH